MDYTYRRTYRGPIRGAVVDLAGTTVDHGSRAPAGAFVELLRRHGLTISDAEARGPMGMEKRDHVAALLALPDVRAQWRAAHGGVDPGEADVDVLYAAFIPIQVECLPQFCDLIPGTRYAVTALRERGIAVAANTGYNREMMEIVLEEAGRRGYVPDAAICASDVAAGRPAPWMTLRCMELLGVYPAAAVVHVGDTLVDIESGLNAGTWSVGVAQSGNMLGLSQEALAALPDGERAAVTLRAHEQMLRAGAHAVIDSIAELPTVVDELEFRLAQGEQP